MSILSCLRGNVTASDDKLISEVRAGRIKQFRGLYRRHYAAAFAYASSCVISSEDAALLTAEAFSRLFQYIRGAASADGHRKLGCFRRRLLEQVRITAVTFSSVGRCTPAPAFGSWVQQGSAWSLEDDGRLNEAFSVLSESSQCLLWHGVVDRESDVELASVTGIPVRSISESSTATRKRLWDLRVYLYQQRIDRPECRNAVVQLRPDGWAPPSVHEHMSECTGCRQILEALAESEAHVESFLPRAVLGWWPGASYVQHKRTVVVPQGDPPYLGTSRRRKGARAWAGHTLRTPGGAHRGPSGPRWRASGRLTAFLLGVVSGVVAASLGYALWALPVTSAASFLGPVGLPLPEGSPRLADGGRSTGLVTLR
ncbi:RNA polymerase sigma factor [Streptomyces sp. NPDC054887]